MQHRKFLKVMGVSLFAVLSVGAGDPTPLDSDGTAQSVIPAASQARSERVVFDVPEQPLAIALDVFGTQADLQVLYESTLAQGRRSAPLVGSFTPYEGLLRLLAGTGLTASYVDAKNVVLRPLVPIALESDAAPASGARLALHALRVDGGSAPDFSAYDGVIALDLQKALRRNAKTRHGEYSVSARIWIDDAGAVLRAELTSSTGDGGRDDAIFHTLRALVVSRLPPENLPEPITVSIVVKPL